jgi:hypothetical protein
MGMEDRASMGGRTLSHPRQMDARFEMAMDAWDGHIARCAACLARGVHLCAEGMCVAFDVSRVRLEIESYERRNSRGSVRLDFDQAQRRLGFPGAPA